jgi:hypothetical protein
LRRAFICGRHTPAAFSSRSAQPELGGVSITHALIVASLIGALFAASLAASALRDLWKASDFLAAWR